MEKIPHLIDAQGLFHQLKESATSIHNKPEVVVIDTRFSLADPNLGCTQYLAGHIPGAYYLDLNKDLASPVQHHGGRHPLPNWDVFTAKLNSLGIHSAAPKGPTQIVIYDDSRFAFAARLWWMLRYLGHDQVAILDGGIKAWKNAGYSLTAEIPQSKAGDFSANPQVDWIVNIETVRQQKDRSEVVVIDARSPERFRGEVEPIDPIAGSIPGAINAFWQHITTESGEIISASDLSAHWADVDPKDEIIVYCGSGVTASVNLFALVVAGYPMPKLYPGGWSDWCSYLGDRN
jgi:thiosulfate/3-mercaptopyruvate sulfurtransferase